jgi:ATP-dependent Clp protease adapter protein ClpS
MTKFIPSSIAFFVTICLLISNVLAALVSPSPRVSSRSTMSMSHPRVSFVGAATTVLPKAPVVPTKINPKQGKEISEKTEDLWEEVRLLNDKFSTHEWVARCLNVVVGTSEWQAYLTTKQAHREGEAFWGLDDKEIAELYTKGLGEQGIVVCMFPVGDFQ